MAAFHRSGQRSGQAAESANIEIVAEGISTSGEAVLGAAFLGRRVRGMACGNVTEELVQESLEHHRSGSNQDQATMILED